MGTVQYLLVVNGHALGAYASRLRVVLEAWRLGFTSYDVQPVLRAV